MWLVIFPEGTRFNPQNSAKLERSQAYADSLGLPRLNHVLMPHTTGFEVGLYTVTHARKWETKYNTLTIHLRNM